MQQILIEAFLFLQKMNTNDIIVVLMFVNLANTYSSGEQNINSMTRTFEELLISFENRNINLLVRNFSVFMTGTSSVQFISQLLQNRSNTETSLTKMAAIARNFSDVVYLDEFKFHDDVSQINFRQMKNDVTKQAREIKNITLGLIEFLHNPGLEGVRRIFNVYDRLDSIKTIGRLVTNQSGQILGQRFFDSLISKTGTCDGKQILDAFWYIIGLYTEGCVGLTISEAIKYNGTKATLAKYCISIVNLARITRVSVFEKCREEKCENIVTSIKKLATINDIEILGKSLMDTLPWFHFAVLRFKENSTINFNMLGTTLNSLRIIGASGDMQIVLWSSRVSSDGVGDHPFYRYGVEFLTDSLLSSEDNLKLTTTIENDRTRLTGFLEHPQQFQCNQTVNLQQISPRQSSGSLNCKQTVVTVVIVMICQYIAICL